jgi:hypothetical protein
MELAMMRKKAIQNRDDLLLGLWDIDYVGMERLTSRRCLTLEDVYPSRLREKRRGIKKEFPLYITDYGGFGNEHYSVLPEMVDLRRLYPIVGFCRTYMINAQDTGHIVRPWIVFYGGSESGINRRDVGSLRYICGDARFVMMRLREMEFKTWMDYRLYTMSMDRWMKYGKIGRRIDFSIGALTQMALLVPKRKKLAMLKKGRLEATKFNDTEAANREMLKTYMDNKVAGVVGNL